MVSDPPITTIRVVQNGDIFNSGSQALVCPVNTVRTLGAGLAKAFRDRFPDQTQAYYDACDKGLSLGDPVVSFTGHTQPLAIIYIPTKVHWMNPSKLEYIEKAMAGLRAANAVYGFSSISIPALGCGYGELDWKDVEPIIVDGSRGLARFVYIYGPLKKASPLARKAR